MLAMAKKRIDKAGLNNVDYYLCDGMKFNFPDKKFDVIFLVTVLGEIENKQGYLREFYRMLKDTGIISISEQPGDPDKLLPEDIKRLMESSGFTLSKFYGTKRNFTINFKKKAFKFL